MRLAAIEAVAGLRPSEAASLLVNWAASDDEDIVAAAEEAMAMARAVGELNEEFGDESDDESLQ